MQVQQHVCGTLRSSICLKWVRSSISEQNTARYYYAMALCYYINLDAGQVFGMSCASALSVDAKNESMTRLLDYTGFPSIEEMANLDAYNTIVQWQSFQPEFFDEGSERQKSRRLRDKRKLFHKVKTEYCKTPQLSSGVKPQTTLLQKLFLMAREHEKNLNRKKLYRTPDYENRCEQAKAALGDNLTLQRWISHITVLTMKDFNCLEPTEVLLQHKQQVKFNRYMQDGEWKYVTYKRKRDPETSTSKIEPIKINIGRFAVLEPIDNLSEVEDNQILDESKKDRKIVKKCKKGKKYLNTKKRGKNSNKHEAASVPSGSGSVLGLASSSLNSTVPSPKRKYTNHKNPQQATPVTPTVQLRERRVFTPSMFKWWKIICKLCGQTIHFDEKDHILRNCTGIPDKSSSLPKNISRKVLSTKRKRRLFDIGEVYDTKD